MFIAIVRYSDTSHVTFTYRVFLFGSRIDTSNLSKPVKIYPLPHLFVVKDLVPVSLFSRNTVPRPRLFA